MAIINIRGQSVEVDIERELREYDFGYGARWTVDKLVASSPFRNDHSPSFFVNLSGEYAGTWGDSGSADEQYSRGNFVSLIAHLQGIGYDEAAKYLLDTYGTEYKEGTEKQIRIIAPNLSEEKEPRNLSDDLVTQAISPYISSRGITDDVQQLYAIGYGENYTGFTAIPWHTPQGRLANVKYRSTKDKRFFYEKDATPVRKLIYGMDVINEIEDDYAVICEGEIDVLSWRTAGVPAIAVGGSHASEEQIDEIKRSRLRRLYLGGDNDEQGRNLNRQIEKEMRGYAEMFEVDYGEENDANDVLMNQGVKSLRELTESTSRLQMFSLPNNVM